MYTSRATQTIGSILIHIERTRTCQSYSEWNVYGDMCQHPVYYILASTYGLVVLVTYRASARWWSPLCSRGIKSQIILGVKYEAGESVLYAS